MFKLLAGIVLSVLILNSASAQESDIPILTLAHDCGPAGRVLPFLKEQYGEEPFALGRAGVALAPGGEPIEGILLMNVNPKTLTYTINILFPEDKMVCMLVAGDKFRPANGSK
jgi:hypothetical protein